MTTPETNPDPARLSHAELLQLKRWNTPTIYNGWEQITRHDASRVGFNLEETRDFMPAMGPMVGFAVTVVFEPSQAAHPAQNPKAWSEYRAYVASVPGPKIVVVQDLDKPRVIGAFWGEVNSNIHRALGCVGTIVDGAIRDVDEMTNAGFKALVRRLCVGHAFSCPVRWGGEVEVFGTMVQPGQLIHADKHGFLAIPREDEPRLLDAARFMDSNECETVIPAARGAAGLPTAQLLAALDEAGRQFGEKGAGALRPEGRVVTKAAALAAVLLAAVAAPAEETALLKTMHWSKLPPIPDREGFAAPFAGVTGGALLVAGGANIPGDKWATPFRKKWYDTVFVLEQPNGKWQAAGRLPHPLAYGVSVTVNEHIYCLGGSNESGHVSDAFVLRWHDGALEHVPLPALPKPCANACGALVGRTIYLAGGLEKPEATVALKTFWALDLDDAGAGWRQLEPWPGPERMLAVAGGQTGSFFLFSGARLQPGPDGQPVREYLRDAYRFTPGQGWKRLADLPRAAVAAPSPAVPLGGAHLLVLTGDDGLNVHFAPIEKHPGFPRDALAYDTQAGTWSTVGEIPFSRATAPVVSWANQFVIPNGEVRPRVRTPEVWSLELGAQR